MAQLDFYGTWTDSWRFLESILAQECICLVADVWYDTPIPRTILSIDGDTRKSLKKRRRVYVFSRAIIFQGCGFVRQDAGPCAGKFAIELDKVGQGIELTLPACYMESGTVNLSCGMAAYPRMFYSEKQREWERPGEEVKFLYATVCGCIKSLSRRQKLITKFGWVGTHAAELLRNGKARIVNRGA